MGFVVLVMGILNCSCKGVTLPLLRPPGPALAIVASNPPTTSKYIFTTDMPENKWAHAFITNENDQQNKQVIDGQ